MFHTSAFFSATASTVLNTQINAVQDDVLTIRNNNLFPDRDYHLLAAYAGSDTIESGRLVTPTFRVISNPNIVPLNATDQPGSNPGIADYRMNPLRIPGGQELEAQGSNNGGFDPIAMIISIRQTPSAPPIGQIYTIRATSTSTATAGLWTNMVLTFDDSLPPGRYAVVGGWCLSATGIAFRLRIPGQLMRPGAIMATALGDVMPKFQTKGGLGTWGEFNNDTLPELEILTTDADTASTLFLDVIQVR
jgi:hypothetical protein